MAVATFRRSEPDMQSHFWPLYTSSPSSTDSPGRGSSADCRRSVLSFLTWLISVVSPSYWFLYASASSSALSLSRFARTLRLTSSMLAMPASSSAVEASWRSWASIAAVSRSSCASSSSFLFLDSCSCRDPTSLLRSATDCRYLSALSRLRWFSPFLARISCCWRISSMGDTMSFGASG